MAAISSSYSVECSVVSVPSSYFETSNFETLQINNESIKLCYGSNTILINEKTSVELYLKRRSKNIFWTVLTFNLRFHHSDLENSCVSKRLVQIVVDEKVSDGVVVVSDDLLFNLKYNSSQRSSARVSLADISFVTLNNECSDETVPTKASKVKLSVFQSETFLENSLIDKILHKYFSYPKYLCNDDVFGVHVDKDHVLDVSNIVDSGIVYFKVGELQGHSASNLDSSHITKGYLVDTSVTLYQVSSHQGFFPSRRIPIGFKPNLHSLLCDNTLMKRLEVNSHNLIPPNFDEVFNTLCDWMKPFLCTSERVQGVELNPVFLLTGPNGSGKTLLVQALSELFGTSFCRVDCVSMGGVVPGQAEAKVKALFSQLRNLAPCILQLANIEALCQDADSKDDVRVMSCFEQEVKALRLKFPVVIVATSESRKSVSPDLHHLFLDTASVSAPSCQQREDCLSWLAYSSGQPEDQQLLHTVASLTSGFVFRDLQVLVALASKERYKRSKAGANESVQFVLSDFSKIIETMHKAYSESIGAPKVPSVSWKDVGGLEHLKKEILRSLKSNIFNTGLTRSGLLLHGPPGTGKTLLAKAVATQCGRNFLSVKGPELLNMYVGQSEHNVRDLFELAKAASPCIVFFDELDSLAPSRGRSGDSGGVMDRVVSQLLAEMDDLGTSGDVFILGATNRPDLLDPALLRPGRLDKSLYVGPCEDAASQLSVLTALTHKMCLATDVNLQEVLSRLPTSVTGAQLSALCSAAWMSAARQIIESGEHEKATVLVGQEHFLSALKTIFNNNSS